MTKIVIKVIDDDGLLINEKTISDFVLAEKTRLKVSLPTDKKHSKDSGLPKRESIASTDAKEHEIPIDYKLLEKKNPKTKKRFMYVSIVFVGMIISVTAFIMSSFTGSSSGIVHNPSVAEENSGLSFDSKPVTVHGTYISFAYPAAFSVYLARQKPAPPILESYEYDHSDIKSWLLSITVTKLTSGSLNADSGYYTRSLDPSDFQKSTVLANDHTFVVMTDSSVSGFSKVAYSFNNGMSADISLEGGDSLNAASLSEVFGDVLNSFTWN
jgi:hypothetical protein